MPTRDEQISFYPKNYYSYTTKANNKKKLNLMRLWTGFVDRVFRFFENKWYDIDDLGAWDGKNFLDIGCWDWKNLDQMKSKWWNAFWFEFGESWFKNNIFYGGNISDIDWGNRTFDLIYISHVFEHIDTPDTTFDAILSLLKPDGKIVLKIPTSHSLSSLLFRQYSIERDIPRHLFTYNKENLTLLFDKKNLEIADFAVLKNYGFFTGIAWFIKDKCNFDLFKSKLKYLFFFTFIIETVLLAVGYTNQIGFVLKKKN